ncbi:MAG: hypothetical protein KDI01_00470 [Halioglobus sp.]|nr:hypothetical protein [Halioglobus sp.]
MTDMPQVRIHGIDRMQVDRVPVPRAGENDVVVQVAHCGICGSDLGYIAAGGLPVLTRSLAQPLGSRSLWRAQQR